MGLIASQVEVASIAWMRSHGVRILVVLGLALAISRVARMAVRRMQRRLEGVPSATQEITLHRTATITQTLSSALRGIIWVLAVLLMLGELGFDLAPLLAGAGIAGVAIAFGAQSLARDFLSGFFILLENQFGVGHSVEVQAGPRTVSGTVEALTLRITTVRAFDGTLHVIPNGNIEVVGNKSRGWARAIVDVALASDEDVDRARVILDELLGEVRGGPEFVHAFLSEPAVLGVETLADDHVVVRVAVQTRPSKKADVERALRERIKRRLDERGVGLPSAALRRESSPSR